MSAILAVCGDTFCAMVSDGRYVEEPITGEKPHILKNDLPKVRKINRNVYLTANYAEIDVVDFRNYNYGLDQLIADNGYDQILVLYSFDSFKSDPYLYRAGVAG